MEEKPFKYYAPFGVNTKRFNKIGFHPNLDISGAMKKEITKIGPGSYNFKKPACTFKSITGWKRKVDMEEFSKYLDFKNANVLNERAFRKTLLGPGWTEVPPTANVRRVNFSVRQNPDFGIGERFVDPSDNNPPPGTYSKGVMGATKANKFTKTPHLEWGGLGERFKDKSPLYWKPPNLYNPIDKGSLDEKIKRVVSLRGPYELFTGPRDQSTIKNHFAGKAFTSSDVFFNPPSDIDDLLKVRKKYGLFLKSNRFPRKPTIKSMLEDISLCYKDPNAPGPASYTVPMVLKTTKKYCILTSHFRCESMREIRPGVGRYNPKITKCTRLKRPSWVFMSKATRNFFIAPEDCAAY